MVVFHWAAGWNVLKICRQGLVDTGILDGEPDFRFAFSVDVLSAKPAKKAFLWVVRSVNYWQKNTLISTNRTLWSVLVFRRSDSPFGEAAFNQRLNAALSDPRRRRLIKFLPLQTVAEREKPLSCNLVSAQEVSRLEREKPPLASGKLSAGLTKGTKKHQFELWSAAAEKPACRCGTSMILTEARLSGEMNCRKGASVFYQTKCCINGLKFYLPLLHQSTCSVCQTAN